ncbi:heme-degrading domain-containing protein [Leeia sp. TBRC 13508]|uniref:UPF0303 protein LIN78_14205 n=1 Tax=Leeia speluncae TaxID=2884804 RepID=A0ABS8D9A0_9NEIS|nr:heme-degrading domain-containing protein [Leeia speluncae]MCB6184697.1 heme-degrading domain-containing protein [Leeia speluncae]
MVFDDDLAIIAAQEATLTFTHFDADIAWVIGHQLRDALLARNAAAVIDICLGDQTLFHIAMPGTAAANAEWARRKRNVVRLMNQSSYAVGLAHAHATVSFHEKMGLSLADYAIHGGSFPIRIGNSGCLGTITVSGLPQREDHAIVVGVLAKYLGKTVQELSA